MSISNPKNNGHQRIFLVEGPDQCGKSAIGQHLAKTLEIPYFKNSVDKDAFAKDDINYFKNCMKYAEPFWLSYLEQSKSSVIMDRGYPSEYVYSSVFGRQTDKDLIFKLDQMYAKLKTFIIFCYRKDYSNWKDDFDPDRIDSSRLRALDAEYRSFFDSTFCRVIHLNVEDHDLGRQTKEIIDQISKMEKREENAR